MPSVDATAAGAEAATAAGTAGRAGAGETPLTDAQRERLQRVFEMYDAAKLGAVGEEQLRGLLGQMGLHPAEDAGEASRVEELFAQLRATGRCVAPDGQG